MEQTINTPRSTDKKVLIVEDDEDFSSILQIKFSSEGFLVVAARNGEEGASMAVTEKPDLIISDMLMPKMDGLEMAKKIRESDKDVQIIFLTNIKDTDYTAEVEQIGKIEYWIKADVPIAEIVSKAKAKLGI